MKHTVLAIVPFALFVPEAMGQQVPSGLQPNTKYIVTCGALQGKKFVCEVEELEAGATTPANGTTQPVLEKTAKATVVAAAAGSESSEKSVKATAAEPDAGAEPKFLAPAVAAANAEKAKTASEAIGNYAQADMTVPSSIAAGLLDIAANKIQHVGTLRELTAGLFRGVGPDGKILSGLALDLAPAYVFLPGLIGAGNVYAPEDATGDWGGDIGQRLRRVFGRTTVSFGTTSPDASGAARTAVGIRIGLFDSGDPGLYWSKVVQCLQTTSRDAPPPPPDPKDIGKQAEPRPIDLSKCDPSKDPATELWKKPSLYVGYGRSWYSKTGSLTDRVPDVSQFWLTGSAGWSPPQTVKKDLRLLGQLYYGRRINDRSPDPDNASQLIRQDSSDTIVRLRAGDSRKNLYFEYGINRVRLGDTTTENLRHSALGAEIQWNFLGNGTDNWIELAATRSQGLLDGKTISGALINFRIGSPALALPATGPVPTK
jgi:hypothetical protein